MRLWARNRLEDRINALMPRLYAISRSWGCMSDVCDDLIQETVTIALAKQDQLRDPEALDCWMIRILVNTHRQYIRKSKWLTTLDQTELVDDMEPTYHLESNHTVERVRMGIQALSDEHRKVLVLVDMEGINYRDTADVLDIKIGTVMSRLARARKRLRKLLSEDDLLETESIAKNRNILRSVK